MNIAQKAYRYKLSEATDAKEMFVDGNMLYKSEWITFNDYQLKYVDLVRTKVNKEGIIEYVEFDSHTNEIIFSSEDSFKKELQFDHTEEALKKRSVLEVNKIAKEFCLNAFKMRKEILITKILEAQRKFIDKNKEVVLNLEEQLKLFEA